MFAAQMRDGAAAVDRLLRLGADPDATTRRGHTALIFAAGRGRDTAVEVDIASPPPRNPAWR